MRNWMSVKQAAEKLNTSHIALLARIRRGTVRAHRVGWNLFIHKAQLNKLLKERS